MDFEGLSLLVHEHPMMPWNDLRRGDCCKGFEATSDGYYCQPCDYFVHKKCGEPSESIQHPSHSIHTLKLVSDQDILLCSLCARFINDLCYRCEICKFVLDLHCANHPPPEVVNNYETHRHKLTLIKEEVGFYCDAKCGEMNYGFPYKCHECDLFFHVDCVWHQSKVTYPPEVNHSYHSLHPLKLLMRSQLPEYSDGKCRLCGRKIDIYFYHCSSCNFTLDMCCLLNPPPQFLMDAKAHDHQLTLLPRLISFTCNACGLNGDRSPYMCLQCDFVIHKDCIGLPRLININRHDHRVSRIPLIGAVDSVCGVCRQKVDWTCGGYSCQKCLGYVVHSKCATRKDVWNGKELEGIPEEIEDIEPYVVIDDKTIKHFSHKEHYLRFYVNDILWEENKHCNACTQPIGVQSFYGCTDCDFILHQKCAELRTRKWHVLHNDRLTLVTNADNFVWCNDCATATNGFLYQHGNKKLDVKCGEICEPFFHPSHPHHALYYIPVGEIEFCDGCDKEEETLKLRCIENDCGFVLDFRCATLPLVVKHRVDDYPLSLCYGEEASGKYWCDICEKETLSETWFYTCKDHQASLHIECVLGDLAGLMPRTTIKVLDISYEVMLNKSVTRPICRGCKSLCIYPIILKELGTSNTYICSFVCLRDFVTSKMI